MNEYSTSSSETKLNTCANILLTLPFKEGFLSNETFIRNVTTYAEVRSNQIIYDETSRVMELYMALHAMMDFNQRNNATVPITREFIKETCPNFYVPSVAVSSSENMSYDIVDYGTKNNSTELFPDYNSSKCDSDETFSIIGPMDSTNMNTIMTTIVEFLNKEQIFQMTPFSFFDEDIMKDNDSNNFARSTSDAKDLAKSFVDYLRFLKRDFVSILYDIDCEFCEQVVSHIVEIKRELTIENYPYNCRASLYSPGHCKQVLMELKRTKFSTIVFVEGDNSYQDMDQIMEHSINYGLVSKEHMWIVIPHELNDDYYIYRALKCFRKGSKEEQFVRGVSIYEYRSKLKYDHRKFLVEGVLDSNLLPMIKSRTLMNLDNKDFYEVLRQKSLSNAAYVYDTVISMLFSLCLKGSVEESNMLTLLRSLPTFWGATGLLSFDDDGNRMNLQYYVSYIEDNSCADGKADLVMFDANTNGTWIWIKNAIYFDGTASPPDRLRVVNEDMNYLTAFESWGTFAEVLLVLCVCSTLSLFVEKFKDKRGVQLAQPFYLHSLCFSCVLFSLHIIPYGLDENIAPFGRQTLDMLCMMMPIARSAGYLFIVYTVFIKVR